MTSAFAYLAGFVAVLGTVVTLVPVCRCVQWFAAHPRARMVFIVFTATLVGWAVRRLLEQLP